MLLRRIFKDAARTVAVSGVAMGIVGAGQRVSELSFFHRRTGPDKAVMVVRAPVEPSSVEDSGVESFRSPVHSLTKL